ncbi:ATP-binding protein [uncultured Chitinophaga sp.]|uniref:ATP-binding response regulator n=1 Tax=uncultured Chitinophaga sp. TaxID=339340 RepID=UPI0025D23C69|nr:ATP-binding protein [uncultured Chitinophaga sp.]
MLSHWLNSIKKTGLTPQTEEGNARKIMVVNSFSFLTALLAFLYGIVLSLLSGEWVIFYAILVFVTGFIGVLLLNRQGYYTTAKFSLSFVFCCLLLYYGVLLGKGAEVSLLGLFLIGMPLVLFNRKERAVSLVCVFLPVVCLVLLEANYYYDTYPALPLSNQVILVFRWLIMAVILLLNFLIINFHQRNIDSLLAELGVRNKALQKSRETLVVKEVQLKDAYHRLENYNQQLEQEVLSRTRELELALTGLQVSHSQLQLKDIELEKNLSALEDAHQRLAHAKEQAESANHAKSRFLREISHEIRNPLNAIIGMSHLLLHDDHMEDSLQPAAGLVRNIYASSHSLLGIISNVLELAKIEAGKTDVVIPEPFVLREWLHNTVSVYETAARMKGVELQLAIDTHLPSVIKADRAHLTQIVNNLVTNAIKFTPEQKKVLVQCRLETGGTWSLLVTDEGMGIAADKLELIFQPFEQAEDYVYHTYGGSGLGLSIARSKARLLGGNIYVSSVPGQGTSFRVALPLMQEQGGAGFRKSRMNIDRLPEGMKILVMEDDKINQVMMRGYFASMGLAAVMTDNGAEGMAAAATQAPHLIILDMHMPLMSGREVLAALRSDPVLSRVPVIAVSADAFSDDKAAVLAAGASEYLVKPVEFSRFYEAVKKCLQIYSSGPAPVP